MSRRRIGVRGIVMRGETILAVKHKSKDGKEAEYWAIPGGGLDPGEDLMVGVEREIYEELGIRATVGRLLFLQQFSSSRNDSDEELEFFFLIEDSREYDCIDLTSTSHGAAELARVEFINPKQVKILPKFLSEIDITEFVMHDKATALYNYLERRIE